MDPNNISPLIIPGRPEPTEQDLFFNEILGLTNERLSSMIGGVIQLLAYQNMRITIIEKDLGVKFRKPTDEEVVQEEKRIEPIVARIFGLRPVKKEENEKQTEEPKEEN